VELEIADGGLEGPENEWFDEDYGLSHTRREAEELRLQQLQIEQEVSDNQFFRFLISVIMCSI